MTDSTTDTTQDPAAIEQEIRRTQEEMSRTVDKIGNQFTARNLFNALLDKADENDVDARMLIDGARRNPVALGLIAAGAIWLVSDKDSKFPSLPSGKSGKSGGTDFDDTDGYDTHHRDYVSHMSSVELREGEDPVAYQRRRDIARSNFLMVERNHDEDDHGFKQRLDSMTETFRNKRRAWSDSAGQAQAATGQRARAAAGRTQELYASNPLVGGILAAAIGAAFGSALPISRQEQEKLGTVGEKARSVAGEQKDAIASQLREKKDQVLEKADGQLQQSSAGDQPAQSSAEYDAAGTSEFQPQAGWDGPAR
jgi:hypothetical protein